MNKLIPLLSLLLWVPAAHAADGFEGAVAMKITPAGGNPMTMTYTMKGSMARMDMDAAQGGMGAMIMDMDKKEVTVLMPQQNMYMKQPIPQDAAQPQQNQPQATIEKTSVTEKILGYDTTKYIAKSGDTSTELWLADGLGSFPNFSGARGGMMARGGRGGGGGAMPGQEWANALKGKPGFPLRVVTKDAAGKETMRMEATSVDKKTVPDSQFAPPAGAQDIGAMMQGAMRGAFPGGFPGRGGN